MNNVAFSQINSSPLYNRSVSCELAATFVTQWKAYPISTSLICTTG
jgi:FMN-dependent NADH-azoreductase